MQKQMSALGFASLERCLSVTSSEADLWIKCPALMLSVQQPFARFPQQFEFLARYSNNHAQARLFSRYFFGRNMKARGLIFSALIGVVASARSMTPMASQHSGSAATGPNYARSSRLAGPPSFHCWCAGHGGGRIVRRQDEDCARPDCFSGAAGTGDERRHCRRCARPAWS